MLTIQSSPSDVHTPSRCRARYMCSPFLLTSSSNRLHSKELYKPRRRTFWSYWQTLHADDDLSGEFQPSSAADEMREEQPASWEKLGGCGGELKGDRAQIFNRKYEMCISWRRRAGGRRIPLSQAESAHADVAALIARWQRDIPRIQLLRLISQSALPEIRRSACGRRYAPLLAPASCRLHKSLNADACSQNTDSYFPILSYS